MAQRYELYRNAGEIPFAQWRTERGIVVPVFDKDGTLTHANSLEFVEEVMDGLVRQDFPDIFPEIALVSNNDCAEHVQAFSGLLRAKLGVGVFAVSLADGLPGKPDKAMGLEVARHFGTTPERLGIIGDRYFTDVKFGRNLGAGAIALCNKAGEGDVKWVPTFRVLEKGIVAVNRFFHVARDCR